MMKTIISDPSSVQRETWQKPHVQNSNPVALWVVGYKLCRILLPFNHSVLYNTSYLSARLAHVNIPPQLMYQNTKLYYDSKFGNKLCRQRVLCVHNTIIANLSPNYAGDAAHFTCLYSIVLYTKEFNGKQLPCL